MPPSPSKNEQSPLTSFEVAILIQIARGFPFGAAKDDQKLKTGMSKQAWEIAETIDCLQRDCSIRSNHASDIQDTAQYFLAMAGAH